MTATQGRVIAEWFNASVNRRILGAAFTVAGFSVVVKATATMKELAVAYRFGTGDAVDAFLIAFLVPQLLVNVFAGSLSAAFTPVYIHVRETQGESVARRLLGSAVVGSSVLVLVVMAALTLISPFGMQYLGSGFNPVKLALTRTLFLVLLPIVPLNAVITLWSGAINAEERFASVALAPICVPLLTLVLVIFAAPAWGIYSLALGTVFGFLAQCVVLAIALKRRGLPIVPRWGGLTAELRTVFGQYMPMVAGAVLTSSSWAIGQAMAAMLPAGSVASLGYGNKVVAMISEVGSMALATALLPHFSIMAARRDWAGIRRTVRVYVRLIALVAIPATAILVVLSPLIIRLLFQRGAFTDADTRIVGRVQALYVLQVPFVMIGMLFVRLSSALQKNQILLIGAAITLPINVALNLLLMRWMGVAGIALSTSLVFVVSCCYLLLSGLHALGVAERRHTQSLATS